MFVLVFLDRHFYILFIQSIEKFTGSLVSMHVVLDLVACDDDPFLRLSYEAFPLQQIPRERSETSPDIVSLWLQFSLT